MKGRDQLTITLSHADRLGNYRVTAYYGFDKYMHVFNPADENGRQRFAKNAMIQFDWEQSDEQFREIETALMRELQHVERAQAEVEQLNTPRIRAMHGDDLAWLWPGRIAVGKLCVIAGDPGLGKSLLTLDIAARVSAGKEWPDGSGNAPRTAVLLLSAEDGYVDTVRPRLMAAGADLDNIYAITGLSTPDDKGNHERSFDLSTDLDKLRERLLTLPEPRLLIIDPVSSFLGSVSENANAEIRGLLKPLGEVANETKTTVILVTHLRKMAGSNLHRVIGSIAIAAIARTGYVVLRANDRGARVRKLVPIKGNLKGDHTALVFHVREDEQTGHGTIVWDDVVPHEEIDMPSGEQGRPSLVTDEHVQILDAALADGPKTIAELEAILGDPAINKQRLQRLTNERYRWLNKENGKAALVALREDRSLDQ